MPMPMLKFYTNTYRCSIYAALESVGVWPVVVAVVAAVAVLAAVAVAVPVAPAGAEVV